MSVQVSPLDFCFTCVGLVCLLVDVVLDVLAAVAFYQEEDYVSLGLLLLFLVGSSVLVQVFSWLWYGYEKFETETNVESSLGRTQLKVLHVFQLGIYVRHAAVVEMSLRSFFVKGAEGYAAYVSHDLSLLRLIETFSEGAPQFVLMLTLILRRLQLDPVTVLKAAGSASAIACNVTMYHRCLRSFLPDKEKQSVLSSVVYFLWNLCLTSSRLTALALFASAMPCFVFAHFFCSWLLLFFFAWRSKTNLMDSTGGEWLYRATVGLIWYFDWFNVAEGKTRNRTLLYHGYMLADVCLLCGLWYWRPTTEPSHFEMAPFHAAVTAVSVAGVYVLGLLCKITYYKCYHPSLNKGERRASTTGQGPTRSLAPCSWSGPQISDLTDTVDGVLSAPAAKRCNKRMKQLAENFYS